MKVHLTLTLKSVLILTLVLQSASVSIVHDARSNFASRCLALRAKANVNLHFGYPTCSQSLPLVSFDPGGEDGWRVQLITSTSLSCDYFININEIFS